MANPRQDLPPPGGYGNTQYRPHRAAKPRRFRGSLIYGFIGAVVVAGTWAYARDNQADRYVLPPRAPAAAPRARALTPPRPPAAPRRPPRSKAKDMQLRHAQLARNLPQLPPPT